MARGDHHTRPLLPIPAVAFKASESSRRVRNQVAAADTQRRGRDSLTFVFLQAEREDYTCCDFRCSPITKRLQKKISWLSLPPGCGPGGEFTPPSWIRGQA